MSNLGILDKLETLPDNLKQEAVDFIDFLVERAKMPKKKIIPQAGSAKGLIKIYPDFDEPLDDFKEYM